MHKHSTHCTRGLTTEERLLHYLPDRPANQCWMWTGTTNGRGYGVVSVRLPDRKPVQYRVHRLAYETWVGPIPDGLTLDHVKARGCTSTLCCNPAHLEPVTAVENVQRGESLPMRYARAETCVNGHQFDEIRRVGDKEYRGCRTCRLAAQRRYEQRTRKTETPERRLKRLAYLAAYRARTRTKS